MTEASEAPETLRLLVAFAPQASEAPETLRLVGRSRARSSRGRDILRNLRWLVKFASENGEAAETLRLVGHCCARSFRSSRNATPAKGFRTETRQSRQPRRFYVISPKNV